MATDLETSEITSPGRLEGKYKAILVFWFLGTGSLISWNSVLTIGDYYYDLFLAPEQNALGNLLFLEVFFLVSLLIGFG